LKCAIDYRTHHLNVNGVAERSKSSCPGAWKPMAYREPLEETSLYLGEKPALWPKNRYLGSGHSDERRTGIAPLRSKTGRPELQDMLPKIPFLPFAVPLKLS